MKISLISFDYWGYDAHIVQKLRERGIEATHLNMGTYRYKNFSERIKNAISKSLMGKNIKHIKRQQYVLEALSKLGHQDQILILNPHTLDLGTIEAIKKHTDYLITYLYDNLERFPVESKLAVFDKIFSFEDKDVLKHGFEKITNYNYLSETPLSTSSTELDLFYITSYDKKRNKILGKLDSRLTTLPIKSKIIIVGKQIWKQKLKNLLIAAKTKSIELRSRPVYIDEVLSEYQKSKVLLDLMRKGQEGLSFRVFEAMAMGKKIITDNPTIKDYDFYDPQNILYITEDLTNLDLAFFISPYRQLPQNVFANYTLNAWLEKVFNLEKSISYV